MRFHGHKVPEIIGSDRLTIIEWIALDSPQFCLVDTLAYLK